MRNILKKYNFVNHDLQCEFDYECKLLATEERQIIANEPESIMYVCAACAPALDAMDKSQKEFLFRCDQVIASARQLSLQMEIQLEVVKAYL